MQNYPVTNNPFKIDAPILTSVLSLKGIDYPKEKIEIISFKSFDEQTEIQKKSLIDSIENLFNQSHADYVAYQDRLFSPVLLTKDNSDNDALYGQHGLFAKEEIQGNQILGFYAGIYVETYADMEIVATQFDLTLASSYGNGCIKEGLPAICGHYNGNYMSIINDWRPYQWQEASQETLDTIKDKKYAANSVVFRSGRYYFIAYFAKKNIEQGTQIFTDYGEGYWQRDYV